MNELHYRVMQQVHLYLPIMFYITRFYIECSWEISLYPPHNEVVEGIMVSLRPSVLSSRIPCPLRNFYISGWFPPILGTNDH